MVLTDLKPGIQAYIEDISKVSELLRRRLIDLGVMEGAEVCVRHMLPFGGPLMLAASGQSIGIRRSDADRIRVVPA